MKTVYTMSLLPGSQPPWLHPDALVACHECAATPPIYLAHPLILPGQRKDTVEVRWFCRRCTPAMRERVRETGGFCLEAPRRLGR